MTILTKLIPEKKSEKLVIPINDGEADENKKEDSKPPTPGIRMVILPTRRVSATTTLFLLLTALMVVGIGIVGGTYLYQQYIRSQLRFKGWCNIPLNENDKTMYISQNMNENLDELDPQQLQMAGFLTEEFEVDLEKEMYEKIEVPDFREGRSGRFIHDFNMNLTGIVDRSARRCFVMPLDRGMVLPPRSLYDLIHKMWDGYYKVNTQVVRTTMRVSTPALTKDDLKSLGVYIAKECQSFPVYKLEKFVDGVMVVKRSAEPATSATFIQFAGNGIAELDILNLSDAVGSLDGHLP